MKIFVDIGAYNGDTLNLALKYDYDIIHCFEPVPEHYLNLISRVSVLLNGPEIIIHPYGLMDHDCIKTVYAAGSDGASVFSSKKQFSHQNQSMDCTFRNASNFFKQFYSASSVHVKINCEGAEWAIISRLILYDRIRLITDLCVHMDVLKIPGMEHLALEMENKLKTHYQGQRLMIGRNKQIYSDYKADLGKEKKWVENWLKHINN